MFHQVDPVIFIAIYVVSILQICYISSSMETVHEILEDIMYNPV
jgi:hypothetical protein